MGPVICIGKEFLRPLICIWNLSITSAAYFRHSGKFLSKFHIEALNSSSFVQPQLRPVDVVGSLRDLHDHGRHEHAVHAVGLDFISFLEEIGL